MKYLFIDTSTSNLIVAVVVGNELKYFKNEKCMQSMSVRIMPVIDEAMKESGILVNEINKIFVSNGPGSFTGIRIGITFVKTLAWALNIPVVPVSTLEVMASKEASLAVINARRGFVFAGGYDDELNNVFKDKYVLLENIDSDLPFVSYDELDVNVELPEIDIIKVINKHKDDRGINPHSLNPVYLKQTEAEEKLNG